MSQDHPVLPQEIVEDIVDYVAEEDFDSLRVVARTSRHFLERCRRHLFRNVYIGDVLRLPPGTWKMHRLNPSLFKYGRRLVVQARLPGFDVTESVFREVLGHLNDLQGADIDVRWNYEQWSKFGLFDLFPDVTHLSIHFCQDLPLDVFYSFPRLQELRVTYAARHNRQGVVEIPGEPDLPILPWRLKSLHYYQSSTFVLPLLQAPNLGPNIYSGLSHLSLDIKSPDTHGFLLSRVLPACSGSPLETLHLWYGGRFSSWRNYTDVGMSMLHSIPRRLLTQSSVAGVLGGHTGSLDNALPTLPSLRYLSIGIRSFREHGDQHPFAIPHRQAVLLSTILDQTVQPALEALDLSFSWGTRRFYQQDNPQQLVVRDTGWGRVDSILSSAALYPHLRAIRVTAYIEDEIRPTVFEKFRSTDSPELARTVKEQALAALPETAGRAVLLDFGLEDTQRDFDFIVNPIMAGAWSYIQAPYIARYLGQ